MKRNSTIFITVCTVVASIVTVICTFILFVVWLEMNMKDSICEYHIEQIEDFEEDDYFTTSELEFARVEDVIIVPEVKDITHDETIVYIAAYSKNGSEKVTVKSVRIKDNGKLFFEQEEEQNISYDNDSGCIYGYISAGTFTEEDMEFQHGKKLYLTVSVQVENESQTLEKDITYEISLIQYRRHVMPT